MNKKLFYDEIDRIVLNMIKKHPDFYFLMKSGKGIHPIDIKQSLIRLYRNKKIKSTLFRKIMRSAKDRGKVVIEDDNFLPVPHLLDYDWRFSKQGNEKIFSLIKKNCKKEGMVIAFVGTPSLFKKFFSKGEKTNNYILIDKNADKHVSYITRYAQNFSYIKYDFFDGKAINLQADLVIMDPPWYLNYNKMFFQFANSLLSIGGKIICVLPPKYTRKNIGEELDELKIFIGNLGIEFVQYLRNEVSYNTPPFERNTLKINGIYCMPKGWRTGDVLIAKKKLMKNIDTSFVIDNENRWDEISVGIVRYKLKTNNDLVIKSFDIEIEKIYPNNIYPSVKRSMSISEKKINVWTSGNRVLYCSNISLLYYILLEYSSHYQYYDMDINDKIEANFNIKLTKRQKDDINKCIKFIEKLNRVEQLEYGKWGKM